MPKMSHITLFEQKAQYYISIRTKTSLENLPKVIGESYGKLFNYLEEQEMLLCEVPFVAYYNMDMKNLDVEMGFPVAKPLSATGEILAGLIPAGKAIFCMYRGPYSQIEPIYCEMEKWIEKNGYQGVGTAYEYYYNDFDFPESELLTKIVMPLK